MRRYSASRRVALHQCENCPYTGGTRRSSKIPKPQSSCLNRGRGRRIPWCPLGVRLAKIAQVATARALGAAVAGMLAYHAKLDIGQDIQTLSDRFATLGA